MVTPQIGSLLEAVSGKPAFVHLCSLIRSWRDRSIPLFEANEGRVPAVKIVQALGIVGEMPQLKGFLDRFGKVKLAEIINEGKENRTSADPMAITTLIGDLGWEKHDEKSYKVTQLPQRGSAMETVMRWFRWPPVSHSAEPGRQRKSSDSIWPYVL